MKRLETHMDSFSRSADAALDRNRLDGSALEDEINAHIDEVERATHILEDRADDNMIITSDVMDVLGGALRLEMFMQKHRLTPQAQSDWAQVKRVPDEVARSYNVAWVWTVKPGTSAVTAATSSSEMTVGDRTSRDQTPRAGRVGLTRETVMTASTSSLAREVRHELFSDLPYYSVLDWIEFEVQPDNTVVLCGQVTLPPDTKSRAEAVGEDINGVNRVINNIEILPVSPNDDRLRRALYWAVYDYNSPLFRYGVGSRHSIHLIVKNGRATLKGVVDNESDKQLAYVKARGVSGHFEVTNELRIDGERRMMR